MLQQAQEKGLDPEDYDASRWAARLQQLTQPGATARFDLALTVCLMRYVSDLHVGRVNPNAGQVRDRSQELPLRSRAFLRQDLVSGQDVNSALNAVEPQFPGYQRTLVALHHYLELARQDAGTPLPVPPKTLEAGSHYTECRAWHGSCAGSAICLPTPPPRMTFTNHHSWMRCSVFRIATASRPMGAWGPRPSNN